MKYLFVIFLLLTVASMGYVSAAHAHPHATPELMQSHSHDPNDANFQEEFILHDFEHVIISTFEWLKNILFG
ncbi:hypothetical protein AAA799P11_00955 [Marine Group I thaumarchaeote SCGC AAA799-P11]|uniref:Uncharacterized protein n=1 Tax=Marine Group I thaumarchaeote SCGC AAA799-P11 TaxID=1502295 RepID=A0A087RZD0_9ARCH|nr:hypothetical protein AAA799P11_00955 [Marine Group I thaumarchaeote SCGC AAA799-P11]